jgi:hypothetical protein
MEFISNGYKVICTKTSNPNPKRWSEPNWDLTSHYCSWCVCSVKGVVCSSYLRMCWWSCHAYSSCKGDRLEQSFTQIIQILHGGYCLQAIKEPMEWRILEDLHQSHDGVHVQTLLFFSGATNSIPRHCLFFSFIASPQQNLSPPYPPWPPPI